MLLISSQKICGQFDLCSHEYSHAVRARICLGEVYYSYETAAIRLLYVEVIAETQALPRAYPKKTDPADLAIAKIKLLILAQFELFPVKLNLQSGITTEKRSNRIAGYSPFVGPGANIRSTGRLHILAETTFETKHPIILDFLSLVSENISEASAL